MPTGARRAEASRFKVYFAWSNYKKYKKDEKANNNITKPKLSKIMVQESLRDYLMKHILY